VLDAATLRENAAAAPLAPGAVLHAAAAHRGHAQRFLATPAIGDVGGDRRPSRRRRLNGRVYAWNSAAPAARLPLRIKLAKPAIRPRLAPGRRDLRLPALADLNGDASSTSLRRGRPARLRDRRRAATCPAGPCSRATTPEGDAAKILSSPAIGDLDGDHRPDVVEGTARSTADAQTTGRVYAFDRLGAAARRPIKPKRWRRTPSACGRGRADVAVARRRGRRRARRVGHRRITGDPRAVQRRRVTAAAYASTGRGGALDRDGGRGAAFGVNRRLRAARAGGPLGLFGA